MLDIRQKILAEMDRRQWSAYKLAKLCERKSGVTQRTVWSWLRGHHDSLGTRHLEVVMELLELEIVRGEHK